jgi:hypothetical protein
LVDFISSPRDVFGTVNIWEIWSRAFVINTEQKMYFEPADEVCEVVYLAMYVTGHEVREGDHLDIAILSLTSALDGGGRAAPRHGRITWEKEIRSPWYKRVGSPQGRFGRMRKISPSNGIRSPDRPARSESLTDYTIWPAL